MSTRSSHAARLRAGRLSGLARRGPVDFMRKLFWLELRDNAVSLRGLSPSTRVLGRIGFVLLATMVASLVFNDVWRAFPLIDAPPGQDGRGTLVPIALVPVTLLLVSVGCAFMLAGAMRARPAIAVVTLFALIFMIASWSSNGADYTTGDSVLAWGPLALIPIVFVVRRRSQPRPALDFCLMLIFVATALAVSQERLLRLDDGSAFAAGQTRQTILLLIVFVLPLLLYIGVDIADFAHRVADWTVAAARETRHGWLIGVLLVLGLAWQIVAELGQVSDDVAEGGALGRYAGALGVLLLVGAAWWLFMGRRSLPGAGPDADVRPGPEAVTDMGRGVTLWLILAYFALFIVTQLVGLGYPTLRQIGFEGPWLFELVIDIQRLGDHTELWNAGVDIVVLGLAVWLRRRGRTLLALYLALVALLHLWSQLTEPGRLLGALSFDQNAANAWWVAAVTLVAAVWLVRGRMTAARAQALLLILVIVVLMGQSELLEDPFAPFVGFSGIAIIALGLLWDVLTFGPWVNGESPGLPRASRLFIYLGYVLFGVTLMNWSLTAHVLPEIEFFTGNGALQGFTRFGTPLLYVVFGLVLATVMLDRRLADRS
ncbi:MAG: hypothetical protein WKF96_21100, partial [Solirubrobacteraceae bacterium]